MTYKSTRRQWVKLWVNEWLDGTTRFELTAQQRIAWVDLLALAGRSRFPGFIYAGTSDAGRRVGYPIAYLSGVLQMDEVTLNNALKLLLAKGHITLEESSPEQFIIGIVNWEKYQSEYLRQKAYRKVTTETTKRLPVEVEEEGEVSNPPYPPLSPKGGKFTDMDFWGGTLRVYLGNKKRLLSKVQMSALVGSRVDEAEQYFAAKGLRTERIK